MVYWLLLSKINRQFVDIHKQGSFITGVPSTALAAAGVWNKGNLVAIWISIRIRMGINLPAYSTYMQSFNFKLTVLPEILLDEKKLFIITQLDTESPN